MDKNEHLKGLEHLDFIYQAILKKKCLDILYQSFKARHPNLVTFPYILKEFNNRWFIIGRNKKEMKIKTYALGRIVSLKFNEAVPYVKKKFKGDT